MARVSVEVEPTSLERRESGPVFGLISLAIDDSHFPEHGWSDFVVAVLVELWRALRNLDAGSDNETFSFFDGPYEITLTKQSRDLITVLGARRGPASDRTLEAEVSRSDLEASLRSASETICRECSKRQWIDNDVDRLTQVMSIGK